MSKNFHLLIEVNHELIFLETDNLIEGSDLKVGYTDTLETERKDEFEVTFDLIFHR